MRLILILVALLLAVSISPSHLEASEKSKEQSAKLLIQNIRSDPLFDTREKAVENVFKKYNSPLAPYAKAYIESADKYGVDWALLPSIAGLESTFGRAMIVGSYNAYGWGGGRIYFESWEDGIDIITAALRQNYMDKWGAKNVWEIGPIYAESPTWAVRVNSFMDEINEEYQTLQNKNLTLNL